MDGWTKISRIISWSYQAPYSKDRVQSVYQFHQSPLGQNYTKPVREKKLPFLPLQLCRPLEQRSNSHEAARHIETCHLASDNQWPSLPHSTHSFQLPRFLHTFWLIPHWTYWSLINIPSFQVEHGSWMHGKTREFNKCYCHFLSLSSATNFEQKSCCQRSSPNVAENKFD